MPRLGNAVSRLCRHERVGMTDIQCDACACVVQNIICAAEGCSTQAQPETLGETTYCRHHMREHGLEPKVGRGNLLN